MWRRDGPTFLARSPHILYNRWVGPQSHMYVSPVAGDDVATTISPALNPFRTAVPFCGQTTSNLTGLSPKRVCGSKRVKPAPALRPTAFWPTPSLHFYGYIQK